MLVGGLEDWLPIVEDFIFTAFILFFSLLLALLFYFILRKYAAKAADERHKSIAGAFALPVFFGVVLAGAYLAVLRLPQLAFVTVLLKVLGVLVGVFASIRLIGALVERYARERIVYKSLIGMRRIVNAFIYVIAIIIVIGLLGYDVTALAAGFGISALVVALALQSTLSNYFAGIYITMERSIKIGDYVELEGGLSGFVEEITWRSTKIRTLLDNLVIIPNAKLAESIITNYYDPTREMNIRINCGVSYGSDLEKVERVTLNVARQVLRSVSGGVETFEPLVRFNNFGDSNIEFTVILRVKSIVDQYLVKHEFIKELTKAYAKEGIEIAYPCRNIFLRG
ncbi:MAG: mechanosensitive ion channel family protein [Candidatus Alkanophagales archaeon]|nr:MAG: mechanosensitive ion channel family protein [Candidatus Alkanophagales archaeon]